MEKIETSTTSLFPSNNVNAGTPAPTLAQRIVKIQFHLQNMAQSAIIIGQELIECKKEIQQGDWINWLKKNFNMSQRTAYNFMNVADRFGDLSNSQNLQSIANLNLTQMIAMLALPAGDEETFIARRDAR